MNIQQVKLAIRDSETGVWSQGDEVTIVPENIAGVGENDNHAILYMNGGQQFFVWPNKAAVDNFLTSA